MSTIPSTSVLSLPVQGPDGHSSAPRRPKAAVFAEEAYRDGSESAKPNHQDPEGLRPGGALVGASERPPSNVVRFPGGKLSLDGSEAFLPGRPPAGFLTQIIGQELQPEKLDAPARYRRLGEGIAAYEATLARTKTVSGPAYPIHREI